MIDLPQVDRCAFCDYLSGRRPFTVPVKRPDISVLITREQRGIAHSLVIPTRHAETILDLNGTERHAIVDEVAEVARRITDSYSVDGISVWQNNGTSSDQAIPHLHFHVAGTRTNQPTERGRVPEIPLHETEDIASRLGY